MKNLQSFINLLYHPTSDSDTDKEDDIIQDIRFIQPLEENNLRNNTKITLSDLIQTTKDLDNQLLNPEEYKNLQDNVQSLKKMNYEKNNFYQVDDYLLEKNEKSVSFDVIQQKMMKWNPIVNHLNESKKINLIEDKPVKILSKEEMIQKCKEISHQRMLLDIQHQKFKRIKKIKSKNFRKRQKKEKEKIEELNDEEDIKEKYLKEENDYIKERITLRRKNNSKWIKQIYNNNDEEEDIQDIKKEEEEKPLKKDKLSHLKFMNKEEEEIKVYHHEPLIGRKIFKEEKIEFKEDNEENPWFEKKEESKKETKIQEIEYSKIEEKKDEYLNEIKKEAFIGDQVELEFQLAKERVIEEEIELPDLESKMKIGWDQWTGKGIEKNKKIEKIQENIKNIKKEMIEEKKKERKDKDMNHVIIRETLIVPKEYIVQEKMKDFEKKIYDNQMSHPIGLEWNTFKGHKEFIEPRIDVKKGKILKPLDYLNGLSMLDRKNKKLEKKGIIIDQKEEKIEKKKRKRDQIEYKQYPERLVTIHESGKVFKNEN